MLLHLINYLKAMKEHIFGTERRNWIPQINKNWRNMSRCSSNSQGESEIFLIISFDLCIRVDCGPPIGRPGWQKLGIVEISKYTTHPSKTVRCFFDSLLETHTRSVTRVITLFKRAESLKCLAGVSESNLPFKLDIDCTIYGSSLNIWRVDHFLVFLIVSLSHLSLKCTLLSFLFLAGAVGQIKSTAQKLTWPLHICTP